LASERFHATLRPICLLSNHPTHTHVVKSQEEPQEIAPCPRLRVSMFSLLLAALAGGVVGWQGTWRRTSAATGAREERRYTALCAQRAACDRGRHPDTIQELTGAGATAPLRPKCAAKPWDVPQRGNVRITLGRSASRSATRWIRTCQTITSSWRAIAKMALPVPSAGTRRAHSVCH
jgi:hypothetical protein